MKSLKIILVLIVAFITQPIWYYLLYKVLTYVHATELMWFLYWIYVPSAIFSTIISRTLTEEVKK